MDPRLGEYCDINSPETLTADEQSIIESLLPEINYHREAARANIAASKDRYKRVYEKRFQIKDNNYQIGDMVWLRSMRPAGQAVGKTDHMNTGPYRIIDRVGNISFKIQDVHTNVTINSLIHANRLAYFQEADSARLRKACIPDAISPTPPGQSSTKKRISIQTGSKDAIEIKMLDRPTRPKATGPRRIRGRRR